MLVLIDGNNAAYRAFYAYGELTYADVPTAVAFGFLRELVGLTETFDSEDVVVCWDSPLSDRRAFWSGYKANRTDKTDEERSLRRALYAQIGVLQDDLRQLGVPSVRQRGREADDLIAAIANAATGPVRIVSSDADLYQLMDEKRDVRVYVPSKKLTIAPAAFDLEYGVDPSDWPRVKAIAGDPSDGIPGADDVGLKTAARFVRGDLPPRGKRYAAIRAAIDDGTVARNETLIRLPYPGTVVPRYRPRAFDRATWVAYARRRGFRSLEFPRSIRRAATYRPPDEEYSSQYADDVPGFGIR